MNKVLVLCALLLMAHVAQAEQNDRPALESWQVARVESGEKPGFSIQFGVSRLLEPATTTRSLDNSPMKAQRLSPSFASDLQGHSSIVLPPSQRRKLFVPIVRLDFRW